MSAPAASQPFITFATLLRQHHFAVSPDQTTDWLQAIGLLGPRDINDVRSAAIALLSIPKDREPEFDALFRQHFFGQTIAAQATAAPDSESDALEPTGGEQEIDIIDADDQPGQEATTAEQLGTRQLPVSDDQALLQFNRRIKARLPRRRSYRFETSHRGTALDPRKTLKQATRFDGEVFELPTRNRKYRQRPILVLIDVSGSMQDRSADYVRFTHALAQASDRFEAFTLGTRLTRITPAVRVRDVTESLLRVTDLVSDFDGGTRIGDALQLLLAVPRYAGFARGATVVVFSDGLERDEPDAMIDATRRLSRMAWRLVWLSPLASTPNYKPETLALTGILPYLDSFDDGSSMQAICQRILNLSKAA